MCFPLVFAPLALLPATYIHTHVQRLRACVCGGSLICIPTNCSIVAIVVRDKNLWGSRSTCFVYAQQRPPRDECLAPHTTHPPPSIVCIDLPNKYVYCFYINFVKINNNNKNSCKVRGNQNRFIYQLAVASWEATQQKPIK